MEKLLTPKQVAEILSCTPLFIYRQVAKRKLPCIRLGQGRCRRLRFSPADIEKYLQENRSSIS